MSILIKGMEMPKKGFTHCKIIEGKDGFCLYVRTQLTVTDDCEFHEEWESYPLVPVPPHGRLIDAKPIQKYITDGLNSGDLGYDAIKVMTEIEYAPTIIPAEEGEKT